jgi:hypothetical protein
VLQFAVLKKKGFIMKHLLLFLFLFPITFLQAQWSPDPAVNNPITTYHFANFPRVVVSDGAGGAIFSWSEVRDGNWGVYAQRIDSDGIIRWGNQGVQIYWVPNNWTQFLNCVSDGNGGAIITWVHESVALKYMYAQRINGDGILQWSVGGITICTSADIAGTSITTDGKSGAIITWGDFRSGHAQIYAQNIDSIGTVKWQSNGVLIFDNPEFSAIMCSDEKGGAIICCAYTGNLYAQRINSNGTIKWIEWTSICSAINAQFFPNMVPDGNSGAIITWEDTRNGYSNYDIYAQKIDSNGTVQWTIDGVAICSAADTQAGARIVSDDSGGSIISWVDARNYVLNYRTGIYVQRINSDGIVQWALDGESVDTSFSNKNLSNLFKDGSGGVIIAWRDDRNFATGLRDIYAQKIDSEGIIKWAADGVAICTNSADQGANLNVPEITTDGAGGAIIAWEDGRFPENGGIDIYASQIGADGVLGHTIPVELVSFNANIFKDKVDLHWSTATEINNSGFNIERSNGGEFKVLGFVTGHGTTTEIQNYSFTDNNVSTGKYSYRLKQIDLDGTYEYSKTIEVEITSPLEFSLAQNYPNPFNPSTTIKYAISSKQLVQLKVFDILGREIVALVNEEQSAGNYEVEFKSSVGSLQLASGIYFYKLQTGSFVQTRKMILLR